MDPILIQQMKFDERGLIPAVIQDAATGSVLGFYYVNDGHLGEMLRTGSVAFMQEGLPDHDCSTFRLIDVQVTQGGASLTAIVETSVKGEFAVRANGHIPVNKVANHVAEDKEVSLVDVGSMNFGIALNELYELIADRKENRPAGSYTTYLFDSGLDKILKKVAEESGEVIIASKNHAPAEIVTELADLFYHLIVLMVERGVKLSDVQNELNRRRGKAGGGKDTGLTLQPAEE